MFKQQVQCDFMDHHFACNLSLEETTKNNKEEISVVIYRLQIEVSPTSRVVSGKLYHSIDGELLITFDDTSFGIFSGEISDKIKQELKALGF